MPAQGLKSSVRQPVRQFVAQAAEQPDLEAKRISEGQPWVVAREDEYRLLRLIKATERFHRRRLGANETGWLRRGSLMLEQGVGHGRSDLPSSLNKVRSRVTAG